jgi:hypothetical protein
MIVRVQWEKLVWIALAIVLILVGCGPSAAQSPPTPAPTPVPPTQPPVPTATTALAFPTGIFAKASLTWEFKPDGTYVTEGHTQATNLKMNGTYTVNGDQIAIQDDYFPCRDVVATYDWAYDGEVLSLTAVDDKCRDRANMAWGKWRKKP